MYSALLDILYPKLCIGCNCSLVKNETFICSKCLVHLPLTNFHTAHNNPVEKIFWGRIPIERAFSFLFFRKGNITQKLLHELKYKGNFELGNFLGKLFGERIQSLPQKIDAVVAIPLHKSKLRKRGYNQSEFFAEGICSQLKIQNLSQQIVRKRATETQTKKSRFERWENVEQIFEMTDKSAFENKHILLVDDVITTGATIEACTQALMESHNCKVSVASIAFASHG